MRAFFHRKLNLGPRFSLVMWPGDVVEEGFEHYGDAADVELRGRGSKRSALQENPSPPAPLTPLDMQLPFCRFFFFFLFRESADKKSVWFDTFIAPPSSAFGCRLFFLLFLPRDRAEKCRFFFCALRMHRERCARRKVVELFFP